MLDFNLKHCNPINNFASSEQSYKNFTTVNYDSRVVATNKLTIL